MKHHAAMAALVRLGGSLIFAAGLLATPTLAGDRALIDYLGYSTDGRYFAFEEFGVQDGSGFPYSNIYVVDLIEDEWVEGSPYRARVDDDGASVGDARTAALDMAQSTLTELGISEAAYLLALNGDGEEIGDGHSLSFGTPGYGLEPIDNPRLLELELVPLESSTDCSIIENEVFGFTLSLDGEAVHSDSGTLPASRGCPMDYRVHAVVRPPEWLVADALSVAIIASYPFGFEGPDRRFLAVPLE